MNKDNVLYGVIGLLLGVVIAWGGMAIVDGNHHRDMGEMMKGGMMSMMGGDAGDMSAHHENGGSMQGMMDGMMSGLQGKTGDAFDKAFLAEMIVHHEGAVEMAQAALKSANHAEIKAMANDIISAQTREISQMKQWQQAWFK